MRWSQTTSNTSSWKGRENWGIGIFFRDTFPTIFISECCEKFVSSFLNDIGVRRISFRCSWLIFMFRSFRFLVELSQRWNFTQKTFYPCDNPVSKSRGKNRTILVTFKTMKDRTRIMDNLTGLKKGYAISLP